MAKTWEYADLTKEASENGGPEVFKQMIYNRGKQEGAIKTLAVEAVLFAVVYGTYNYLKDKWVTKEQYNLANRELDKITEKKKSNLPEQKKKEKKMGYRLRINFSNGTSELVDEVFDTYEDAESEYETWLDSWGAGQETLELAGEDYDDSDIVDCDIYEE